MKVSVIVSEKAKHDIGLYAINEDASLKEAAKKMTEHNIGALLVYEKNNQKNYIAIISERDILHSCSLDTAIDKIKVSEVATKDMIVVTSDDTLETAKRVMAKHHIRHLPVINNNTIEGMITIRDVISEMEQQKDIQIQHLSDFVGGTYGNKVF